MGAIKLILGLIWEKLLPQPRLLDQITKEHNLLIATKNKAYNREETCKENEQMIEKGKKKSKEKAKRNSNNP